MIVITKNTNIITIRGHANSADYGRDIVCASVSSIVYTTINAIKRWSDKAIEVIDNQDMQIKILENDEITSLLINNMFDLLNDLAYQYPKNVKVKES